MARDFDGASQYLTAGAAIAAGTPFTIALWVNRDSSIGSEDRIFSITDKSATQSFDLLTVKDGGSRLNIFGAYDGSTHDAYIDENISTGTWYHYVGVSIAADSRQFYMNGVAGTANTDNVTPSGLDETIIGAAAFSGGIDYYFNGKVAEVGFWNVALSVAEITTLSKGYSPLFVRPQSLISDVDLIRGYADRMGGMSLSDNGGSSVSPHPPVIHPAMPQIITAPVAVAGVAPTAVLNGPLIGPLGGPV